jgi:peptidoglycan/LPS O-acetylase OafA/YrhL
MTTYRPDIDGLRAAAVITVILFHAFPTLLPSGFIGVDVFFVISGYLISSIILSQLYRKKFSILDFYSRRIRRIFPSLIVVLAASYCLGWRFFSPPELRALGRHLSAAAIFLSNFLLNSEAGYFDVSAIDKPLLHLWSLSIEEQFYLFWPLLLFLCVIVRISPLILILTGCGASFAHELYLLKSSTPSGFFLPTARFWELMAGAAVAYFHTSKAGPISPLSSNASHSPEKSAPARLHKIRHLLSVAGAALLGAGLVVIREGQDFPGWLALLPVVGTGLLIAAGPRGIVNKHLLSNRLLVGVGLISYPLYLWHWPLLSIAHTASISSFEQEPSFGVRCGIIALSVALAWALFQFIEKPMRSVRLAGVKTALLLILMGAIGYIGHLTYISEGFASRQAAAAQAFYSVNFPTLQAWRGGVCFQENATYANAIDYDKCTTNGASATSPRVLLWGDSHAAHLYPGLVEVFGSRISLTQMTLGRCSPILDAPPFAECGEFNNRVLTRIKREPPDVVILAAAWRPSLLQHVPATLSALQAAGVKKIVVIGESVRWLKSAPLVIARSIQTDPLHRVRRRYRAMIQKEEPSTNVRLRQSASDVSATFVSPREVFCNEEGCLGVNGETPDKIITIDVAHLGPEGSRLLVEQIPLVAK